MTPPYSYHIFHYPFKWSVDGKDEALLSEQIDMDGIQFRNLSMWERTPEPYGGEAGYNERNYYYKFVHNVLYDHPSSRLDLVRHYERKEPKLSEGVTYQIKVNGRSHPYRLKVEAIHLNFYSTGIGILSFFLANNEELQSKPEDILRINQYGRRVMLPFFADKERRQETAEYISIEGLAGNAVYREDFNAITVGDSWKPASFISRLIEEAAENLRQEPVIDDRMFVCSWYRNDRLASTFANDERAFVENESFSDFWYRYLFVDGASMTCQNEPMKRELLEKQTYCRWQKWLSLYGISRYSMVYLTSLDAPQHLLDSFVTIYSRMVELVLLQRASILRFSEEVTFVSTLRKREEKTVADRANSLYREYLQFLNQVYYREVTAQDQGIELYNLLQGTLNLGVYIADLDGEIEELHDYISLKLESKRNENGEWLNVLAAIFLPATILTGIFGMNGFPPDGESWNTLIIQIVMIFAISVVVGIYLINRKRHK